MNDKLIRKLLTPSPQATDNEVEAAIEMAERTLDYILEECPVYANDTVGENRKTKLYNYIKILVNAAQQPRQEWLDIKDAPIDGTPHLLAAYIIPSEEAAKNGSKPYWDFGIGRPIYPARNGSHWTGVVGGNPSHFKYLEPPKDAK